MLHCLWKTNLKGTQPLDYMYHQNGSYGQGGKNALHWCGEKCSVWGIIMYYCLSSELAFLVIQNSLPPIWLKSDLYLSYRIEDLITTHYRWCSVLIILTNQLWLLGVWRYFGSFENVSFIIFKTSALRLKYALWLVEIMTQYANYKVHEKFTWTWSVMESYQILYAIAYIEVWLKSDWVSLMIMKVKPKRAWSALGWVSATGYKIGGIIVTLQFW